MPNLGSEGWLQSSEAYVMGLLPSGHKAASLSRPSVNGPAALAILNPVVAGV